MNKTEISNYFRKLCKKSLKVRRERTGNQGEFLNKHRWKKKAEKSLVDNSS